MARKIVVIPAKSVSRRVSEKNWRPFVDGQCLVERKVSTALRTIADLIVVSTDRAAVPRTLAQPRVEVRSRNMELCGDLVDLRTLFGEVLADFADDVVFWAHPTSPFVTRRTIDSAFDQCLRTPGNCILGVKTLHEFLWTSDGPVNYDPYNQHRSQDLPVLYAVTGGVHCAFGRDFINRGAVSFAPATFMVLQHPEALDINDECDWHIAQLVARSGWLTER
jgi:CMP-N-acetylneuraminic acid synthetase